MVGHGSVGRPCRVSCQPRVGLILPFLIVVLLCRTIYYFGPTCTPDKTSSTSRTVLLVIRAVTSFRYLKMAYITVVVTTVPPLPWLQMCVSAVRVAMRAIKHTQPPPPEQTAVYINPQPQDYWGSPPTKPSCTVGGGAAAQTRRYHKVNMP